MAHGWAGEITHFIADFARMFSAAGITAVVFDHRGWGRSDAAAGKPRHESEPWEQIRDYQHAITYAQNRQDVDPDRICGHRPRRRALRDSPDISGLVENSCAE